MSSLAQVFTPFPCYQPQIFATNQDYASSLCPLHVPQPDFDMHQDYQLHSLPLSGCIKSEPFPASTGSNFPTSSSSAYPVPSASHYPRSSISSSNGTSYLFSPRPRPDLSPSTPPLLPSQQEPQALHQKKTAMANLNSITTPMQPNYISKLSTYLAEMVVYLWYSHPQSRRAPTFPKPSTTFTRFCNDVLMTTQVSQSVVVLSLLFIWKLQKQHFIEPKVGSEYKLTVTALMLANKILDDHTYTNRTWADVSGLPLSALNEGEMEFLHGLDFSLYVSQTQFSTWLELLERPEQAKIWRISSRKKVRLSQDVPPVAPSAPTSPYHSTSTSGEYGLGFDFACPTSHQPQTQAVPSLNLRIPHYSHFPNIPISHQQHHPTHPISSSDIHTYFGSPASLLYRSVPETKKRKMSDDEQRYAFERRPSSSRVSMAGWSSNGQIPAASTSSSGRNPYTIGSSLSTSSSSSASFPNLPINAERNGSLQAIPPQADFSTLISSFKEVDDLVNRNPGNLAYYALAAGQQRGGYLAYQPVQHHTHPARTLEYSNLQIQQSHAPVEMGSRPLARLPKQAQSAQIVPQYVIHGVPGSGRVSLSLSPTDVRLPRQTGRQKYLDASSPLSTLPLPSGSTFLAARGNGNPLRYPPSHSNSEVSSDQRPLASQFAAYTFPVPSSESMASTLSASSPTVALSQQHKPSSHQAHAKFTLPNPYSAVSHRSYSSFSNNGLPGVLHWPADIVARYYQSLNGTGSLNPAPLIFPETFAA